MNFAQVSVREAVSRGSKRAVSVKLAFVQISEGRASSSSRLNTCCIA